MAKRVFTEEERTEYREKMLDAGFDLLKEYGMTHMSVAKITEAAGIGVSTFYNFFESKGWHTGGERFRNICSLHLMEKKRLDLLRRGRI